MPGLQDTQEFNLETPYGQPSAPVITGLLEGVPVAFLARHGIGHHILPAEVNYRANIYALKKLGIERIISISACGSLREDYTPGEIVIPDQLFDFTRDRECSYFGDGLAAHLSIADPFCPVLSAQLLQAVQDTQATVHHGGTMITIEGPRFSTRAESNVFRGWGMSLIGMTTSPEAFLAREAELCYAVMAHVTDYDVWHISEQPVSVDLVVENSEPQYTDRPTGRAQPGKDRTDGPARLLLPARSGRCVDHPSRGHSSSHATEIGLAG